MRTILDKKSKKGQAIIINMVFLVMTIVVLTGFIPVLKEVLDNARHYDSLNCKSNINNCATSTTVPCYNSSMTTSTTSCLMLDLYLPYILIVVLIAGVGALLANRVQTMGAPQYPQSGGYYG